MNISNFINFERLLTLNYKKLGLSDDEYNVLMIAYEISSTGTKFVNPNDLTMFCGYTENKIDVIFSGLISKKLISNEFDKDKQMYTSFDGIMNKLYECIEKMKEQENINSIDENEDIFQYMQCFFERPLSPLDYDVITSWKQQNYPYALIKAACELAKKAGNKSIRYIDTIIYEENKKSAIGEEEYQKQEQETIELSSIDWLDD